MSEMSQMLTPKDVATILGVHQKTVHLWLRSGKLKGIKISYRAWRIPRSSLDEFIDMNSNVPPQKGMLGKPDEEVHPSDNPVTPQTRMKHYIRDIMGEQAPANPQENTPP